MPVIAIVSQQPQTSGAAASSLVQALVRAGHQVATHADQLVVGERGTGEVNVVFALDATEPALTALAEAGDAVARRDGAWLGVMVIDHGDAALTATVARELAGDVLGTTAEACAAAIASRLRLGSGPKPAPLAASDPASVPLSLTRAASAPSRDGGSGTFAVVAPWVLVVVLALLHLVRG
jgi:hypothetical protein